jgi:hypothetical protein
VVVGGGEVMSDAWGVVWCLGCCLMLEVFVCA